jgi:hypothetical protein
LIDDPDSYRKADGKQTRWCADSLFLNRGLPVVDATDTQGVYSPTPAEFTANVEGDLGGGQFSSGSFSFATLAPVPEPTGLTLVAVAAGVSLRRRRKSA